MKTKKKHSNHVLPKAQVTGDHIHEFRPPGPSISSYYKRQERLSKKKNPVLILVAWGIAATLGILCISLFAYFRPFTGEDVAAAAGNLYSLAAEEAERLNLKKIWQGRSAICKTGLLEESFQFALVFVTAG